MQLQFIRRLSRGLQAIASYTWGHSIDIASNDSADNPAAKFIDPRIDRGSSDFDVRHAFSGALTYNVPTPSVSGFGKHLLENWAVDSIVTARSATPVDLIGAISTTGFSSTLRPDLVPGQPLIISDPTVAGGRRFNPAVFVAPAGAQGTLGRNVLRGFAVWQIDLSLRRQFNLTDRMNLQLRADCFNIFNHPNFGDPGVNFNGTNDIT